MKGTGMNDCQKRACLHSSWGVIVPAVLLCVSCYPDRTATRIDERQLDTLTAVQAPAKVFLTDASVALFPLGFQLRNGVLEGKGVRFSSTAVVPTTPVEKLPQRQLRIPKDSAIAMTYFEDVVTGGRGFASVFHGLTGAPLTVISIICLTDPKSCFGSCPTVYTRNGSNWEYQTELFSYSISRLLERADLDRLGQGGYSRSPFTLRVANEALETHYINQIRLIAARHPSGTMAFPTPDGAITVVRDLLEPSSAVNSEGRDVLEAVHRWDDHAYRSDSTMVRQVKSGKTSDWIDVRVRPPRRSSAATVLLRLKNTLLSTVLFYEVVLGSQGVRAIEWTKKMNTGPLYAAQFRSVYSRFSGLKIKSWQDGAWNPVGDVHDVGPVGWKETAIRVPLEGTGEQVLRIEFFPDNFMIDYIAFDFGEHDSSLRTRELVPTSVQDRTGAPRPDILRLLEEDDSQYLVTEAREAYHFFYDVPPEQEDELTLFVRSRGYYTEWIRGNWIAAPVDEMRFDLFQIDRTMHKLSELWLRERASMESLFFRNRVPVEEEL